jgi:uracil-DNA glycosylase
VRVFFDTNVLVSAFLARGLCADLLRLVLREHTLVSSEVVLAELRDVLGRKGRLPAAQIEAIEAFVRDQPVAVKPQQTLQLGLVAADVFVSGDQGVLGTSASGWLIGRKLQGVGHNRLSASSSPSVTAARKGRSRVSIVSLIWW